jgi:hypothetical protein
MSGACISPTITVGGGGAACSAVVGAPRCCSPYTCNKNSTGSVCGVQLCSSDPLKSAPCPSSAVSVKGVCIPKVCIKKIFELKDGKALSDWLMYGNDPIQKLAFASLGTAVDASTAQDIQQTVDDFIAIPDIEVAGVLDFMDRSGYEGLSEVLNTYYKTKIDGNGLKSKMRSLILGENKVWNFAHYAIVFVVIILVAVGAYNLGQRDGLKR